MNESQIILNNHRRCAGMRSQSEENKKLQLFIKISFIDFLYIYAML